MALGIRRSALAVVKVPGKAHTPGRASKARMHVLEEEFDQVLKEARLR
jgi:hypothetical protein